jgi:hypothetical protein
MTTAQERIWQVRLPDGSAWIPPDSRPGDPRSSWIYARSTAEMFAKEFGGKVVEIKPRQKGKVLDEEIASAIAKPRAQSRPRRLSSTDRRVRAAAIAEHVNLSGAGRAALKTARETADAAEYATALGKVATVLPASLWVGHDDDHWYVQLAEPVWITDDPAGENPSAWSRIERAELARILVEDV